MDDEVNLGEILPDDKQLCDRSKKWWTVFKKYEELYANENEDLPIGVLCALSDSYICDMELRVDEESVEPSEFEDNVTQDDPDFNINNVLNQTKPIIEKRKESWSQSGIDRLMNSFCCDKVNVKVDDWLNHNCDYFSSKFSRESDKHCFNEIKINEHNIVMERSFDDSSVDTAKYILSNRKRRKSKVTMTIKQFCYSAQKINDKSSVKNKSADMFCSNKIIEVHNSSENGSDRKSREKPKKVKPFKRKHYSRILCTSPSPQLSSSGEESLLLKKRPNSTLRKNRRQQKLAKCYSESASGNKSSDDDDNELWARKHIISSNSSRNSKNINEMAKEPLKIFESEHSNTSARLKANAENKTPMKPRPKTNTRPKAKGRPSDLNTTNKEVFNSTAIKSQDSMIHCKENFQTICQTLKNSNDANSQIDQNPDATIMRGQQLNNGSTPIIIYSPKVLLPPKRALNAKKVKITEKHLEKSLGVELKNKFLGDLKKFRHECSPNAKLLFIPPDEDEQHVSTDSDADPLDTFGRSEKGKLVEVVHLQLRTTN